jgi:hypothetical protein
MSKRFR